MRQIWETLPSVVAGLAIGVGLLLVIGAQIAMIATYYEIQRIRAEVYGLAQFIARHKSILLIVLLAGCQARAPGAAASWQARSLNDLVAAWGPPAAQSALSDGRQVVSYRRSSVYGAGSTVYTLDCDVTYVADASGQIITSQVRGNRAECNRLVDRMAQ